MICVLSWFSLSRFLLIHCSMRSIRTSRRCIATKASMTGTLCTSVCHQRTSVRLIHCQQSRRKPRPSTVDTAKAHNSSLVELRIKETTSDHYNILVECNQSETIRPTPYSAEPLIQYNCCNRRTRMSSSTQSNAAHGDPGD